MAPNKNADVNVKIDFIFIRDMKAIAKTAKKSVHSFAQGFNAVSKGGMKYNDVIRKASLNSQFFQGSIAKMGAGVAKASGSMQRWFKKFDGWALSVMFFGMAITRVATQITQLGTKTFQDVMHSVDNTTTSFDMLQGSVKFLGFVIGQALEPLAMLMMPIIERITEWVETHEELTRKIISSAFAIGAILTVLGVVWLGMKPIFMAIFFAIKKSLILPIIMVLMLIPDISNVLQKNKGSWVSWTTIIVGGILLILTSLGAIPGVVSFMLFGVFKLFQKWGYSIGLKFDDIGTLFKMLGTMMKIAWSSTLKLMLDNFISFIERVKSIAPKLAEKLGIGEISGVKTMSADMKKNLDIQKLKLTSLKDELALRQKLNEEAMEQYKLENTLGGLITSISNKISGGLDALKPSEGVQEVEDYSALKALSLELDKVDITKEQEKNVEVINNVQVVLDSEIITEKVATAVLTNVTNTSG